MQITIPSLGSNSFMAPFSCAQVSPYNTNMVATSMACVGLCYVRLVQGWLLQPVLQADRALGEDMARLLSSLCARAAVRACGAAGNCCDRGVVQVRPCVRGRRVHVMRAAGGGVCGAVVVQVGLYAVAVRVQAGLHAESLARIFLVKREPGLKGRMFLVKREPVLNHDFPIRAAVPTWYAYVGMWCYVAGSVRPLQARDVVHLCLPFLRDLSSTVASCHRTCFQSCSHQVRAIARNIHLHHQPVRVDSCSVIVHDRLGSHASRAWCLQVGGSSRHVQLL